ncbi:hypothetical protein [Sphingobacterium bovistauri]|uniref:Uncharacterized protein n=1 Tax=Sphingobacterium bovistauri TaxID=2781959 RepID=A0ABS7Z7T6_9SPHI|nr:hypothetical protein [Sphingobacterium bovistauri]MCA5006255.1 hypothetical protein [Sphingobacterium bovistauri]
MAMVLIVVCYRKHLIVMLEFKKYQAPKVFKYEVFIEQSIASGSQVAIRIDNLEGNMESEWQKESISTDLDW